MKLLIFLHHRYFDEFLSYWWTDIILKNFHLIYCYSCCWLIFIRVIKFYHSDILFKNMKIHHYEKNSHYDVNSSKRGRLIPQMYIIQKVTSDCFFSYWFILIILILIFILVTDFIFNGITFFLLDKFSSARIEINSIMGHHQHFIIDSGLVVICF